MQSIGVAEAVSLAIGHNPGRVSILTQITRMAALDLLGVRGPWSLLGPQGPQGILGVLVSLGLQGILSPQCLMDLQGVLGLI